MIWRTASRLVDEAIPLDRPRRYASWVIRWYDLTHSTWYITPDQVTIMIMCIYYLQLFNQMREQTTVVVSGRKRVKPIRILHDGKIRLEDHRLASQGLPSDDKQWSQGTDFFYPTPTRIMDSFSRSPLKTSFYIGKTWQRLPAHPEYAEMQLGVVILTLQWHRRTTCCKRAADVRLFIFLSFPRAGTGMWDRNFSNG